MYCLVVNYDNCVYVSHTYAPLSPDRINNDKHQLLRHMGEDMCS